MELKTTAEQRKYFLEVWNLHTAGLMIEDLETCLAEIERLREVLTKISEFKNGPLDGIKLYSVTELAREALK
jgi:hypothetical protein